MVATQPSWSLGHGTEGAITVEVLLPDVKSASQIDAYAENGVLEVEVEGLYSLRVPLHGHQILEEELSCRFKKKEKKLIVTVPVCPASQATPATTTPATTPAVSTPVDPAPEPATKVQRETPAAPPAAPPTTSGRVAELAHQRMKELERDDDLEDDEDAVAVPFDVPKVELPQQEGLEGLLNNNTEKVSDAKIVDGVSDFSIFRHNLGKEFDAIYAQTRANLPTIEPDDEEDDEEEVEVIDATGRLEALKQRTYEALEAKGLHLTPAPESN